METEETKQKLANAIKDLEAKGDTATINSLVSAYKQKYRSAPATQPVSNSLWASMSQAKTAGQKADILLKRGAEITSGLPGAKLGSALGSSLYALGTAGSQAIQGKFGEAGKTLEQASSEQKTGEVLGDMIKSAVLPGSFAVSPTTALGQIGTGATLGGTSALGESLSQGKTGMETAKDVLKGTAIGGATSAAFVGFGKLLEKAGEKITTGVIKPSAKDIEDGFKLDTIKKYNLGGSLPKMFDKTEDEIANLSHQLNRKLATNNTTIDMNTVLKKTVDNLGKNKLKEFGTNASLGNTVEQIKNEILAVAPEGTLSIPDAQLVKQASGRFGAWQFGMTDPDSTARQTVYNAFYRALKEEIETASPEGVREINKKLGELIPVAHALTKRIPVAERNRGFSFQDMMTLVASTVDPRALGLFGISRLQKSGTAGNILMKADVLGKVAPVAGAVAGEVSGRY